MFTKMRRADRALDTAETQEILQQGSFGFLAMTGLNEYPYGIPLNYVYSENSIYVHAASEGHKLECLKSSNKVTFCVVGEATVLPDKFSTRYKSAIVYGTAHELKGDEKLEALIKLVHKYADSEDCVAKGKQYAQKDHGITAVLRIDIDYMTGKARK